VAGNIGFRKVGFGPELKQQNQGPGTIRSESAGKTGFSDYQALKLSWYRPCDFKTRAALAQAALVEGASRVE